MHLEADAITAGYGGRMVLHAVRLVFQTGEFVGLLGPNGSGKSTLLRVLSGVLPPQSGRVVLDGEVLSQIPAHIRAQKIAFVPQFEPALFDFSALDVVLMGRYPHRGGKGFTGEDHAIARRCMAELDILSLAERPITQLSGGEHRRVLIARALAQEAPLLLLDEPTAHLDITHQIELLQHIQKMVERGQGRVGVIAALHDINQAAEFCERLVLLRAGRVEAYGTPETVLTPAHLRRVYDADIQVGLNPATGRPTLLSVRPARAREACERPHVHLVCGGGSGIAIMGTLIHHGYRVSAGPLNLYDSDQVAAEVLGIEVVLEAPFAPIRQEVCATAKTMMQRADLVCVAPVPIGHGNLPVLNLVQEMQAMGKRVVLLGNERFETRDFTGGKAAQLLAQLCHQGAECYATVEDWLAHEESNQSIENPPTLAN
ncbi:ABC transporter ATP-binding protein [Chthonomonas calidirosea]|uniref:ABC transporter ATP-binding protein n=1 Tax=Chthonomonas calidirosea TaxID=454171 RepID=UPI0006EC44CC|nr:ABC transporter ATP-binding protein [Chthonomonas calidirosea]CEK13795.1 ABC-type cobalamin/Fe3+-siderophore transport system, ATPase component [Chthonomonas calidirosea]